MISFGTVPSRRLGSSLGINNIPAKHCSYSCIYCQVGATQGTEITPRVFYSPDEIFDAVHKHVSHLQETNQRIDYLTFVPDGEPTLDINLAEAITKLRALQIPIAVISNASLISRSEVRQALALADWVSLKIDSVNEKVWRIINRPFPSLELSEVLSGIETFAKSFDGFLATETMLLDGMNTNDQETLKLTDFMTQLQPDKIYLAVPTRPMAESGHKAPNAKLLNQIYQMVNNKLKNVELLAGFEGDAMASTGDFVEDLLSICAVHPMRDSQVKQMLKATKTRPDVLTNLLNQGDLHQVEYNGEKFYLRNFKTDA